MMKGLPANPSRARAMSAGSSTRQRLCTTPLPSSNETSGGPAVAATSGASTDPSGSE